MLKQLARNIFNAAGLEISRKRRKPIIRQSDLGHQTNFYHVGCGDLIADGYLNIDADFGWISANLINGKTYSVDNKQDTFIMPYDLRRGLPAQPETLNVVYHSHLFEHLTDEEGIVFLQDCYRSLAPQGTMRLAIPDFRLWCKSYIEKNDSFFDWYRRIYLGDNSVKYPTNASVFMNVIYNWGHKNLYDLETISPILSGAGFVDIKEAKWGFSDKVRNIAFLENINSQRKVESLVLECSKPEKS